MYFGSTQQSWNDFLWWLLVLALIGAVSTVAWLGVLVYWVITHVHLGIR